MMKYRLFLFLFLIFLFLSNNVFAGNKVKIVLLHTNDLHGHLFPYENSRIAEPPEKIGGFQYLSTLIKKERKENPGNVLLLDGGDISQGSLYSNIAYGVPMVELMNILGYDATVIGNHEFDWGYDKLENLINLAKFPVLGGNIFNKERGTFLSGVKPYIIKDISGVRIAVFGLSTTDTTVMGPASGFDSYYFVSPHIVLRSFISAVKRLHNVDVVILLSHLGYKEDIELAGKIPDIDIIVGGHSHKFLEKPVLAGKTIIVQAGSYMASLGRLEIEVEEHKIKSYKGELITLLNSKIEPDFDVYLILENYKNKYEAFGKEIMGETSVDMTKSNSKESVLGNFVADIMREEGKADVGVINSGGLREEIPSGKVSMEKIYSVYPFENTLVTIDVTGGDLRKIMERCVTGKHGILQISGIRVKFDMSRPEGERIMEIFVGNKPLEIDRVYKIATADFLSIGGDGYEEFKNGKNINNITPIRDLIVRAFKNKSPVFSKIDGRIEFFNIKD